jgi:cytochrome c oxidase subunit 2
MFAVFNLPVGVTAISREIYALHMTVFWICMAIALAVFGVMLWAIVFHRQSRGYKAAHFHSSTIVEIIWSVIPLLILIVMAYPASKLLIKMHDTRDSDLTVKITGYMWRWHYDYLEHDINFMSSLSTTYEQISNRDVKGEHYLREVDHHLVLPINKKIRLLTTANDVIHSWWVPELAVKKDAIPGFINEAWVLIDQPGIYRGQCAELCGARHAYMPIVVEAVPEAAFQAWVAAQKAALPVGPHGAH